MDMFDSLFNPGSALSEQVARQVFNTIPEGGPLLLIMDTNGRYWPSDCEQFAKLNISEYFLRELCCRIGDGSEPVVTQTDDHSIVASELSTENVNCGFVALIFPRSSPECALSNLEVVEMLLRQVNLVGKLIEKNNRLYELQLKHMNSYGNKPSSLN